LLRTPKICKFKDIIKDKFMTISIHILQNNTMCSFNSTSLYFVDWNHWIRVQKNPGFLKPNPVGFLGFIVFLDKQEKIGKIIQNSVT